MLSCAPRTLRNALKRYHQELGRTIRTHRVHLRESHQWPRRAVICSCEFQVGRFRKQAALGCGKSRCLLCHFEKIFGIASAKDRMRHQRFIDSWRDYLDIADS
jgi:hypothetical protein